MSLAANVDVKANVEPLVLTVQQSFERLGYELRDVQAGIYIRGMNRKTAAESQIHGAADLDMRARVYRDNKLAGMLSGYDRGHALTKVTLFMPMPYGHDQTVPYFQFQFPWNVGRMEIDYALTPEIRKALKKADIKIPVKKLSHWSGAEMSISLGDDSAFEGRFDISFRGENEDKILPRLNFDSDILKSSERKNIAPRTGGNRNIKLNKNSYVKVPEFKLEALNRLNLNLDGETGFNPEEFATYFGQLPIPRTHWEIEFEMDGNRSDTYGREIQSTTTFRDTSGNVVPNVLQAKFAMNLIDNTHYDVLLARMQKLLQRVYYLYG